MQQLPMRQWWGYFAEKYGLSRLRPWGSSGRLEFEPRKLRGRKIIIRRGRHDIHVLADLLASEFYMPEKPIDPMLTIVDLGANIGCTSVHFAACFPRARIIGVELEKENFLLAQENTLKDRARIELLHGAIWGSEGLVSVHEGRSDAFRVACDTSVPGGVRAITMAALFEKYGLDRVDYLKMDIEGAEEQVLLEDPLPHWLEKIRHMQIEVHREELMAAIQAKLQAYRFHTAVSEKHWSAVVAWRG